MTLLVAWAPVVASAQERPAPFGIHLVDEATGRGVPLVTLRTMGSVEYVSDSNGWVAFDEPGLLGEEVWFHVSSHGYEVAPDGFKQRGARLKTSPGGRATVKVRRTQVAERLYRVTGAGIYRDSVLLGEEVPLKRPTFNGGVLGQDSVLAVRYRGRVRWIWGDTHRASYPLGNFNASGATSVLPSQGGLDPSRGVQLTYFVGEDGFSRGMTDVEGPGPKWLDALMVVPDAEGAPRMVARFMRMKSLGEAHEQGMVVYDDEADLFRKRTNLPLDAVLAPRGHPVEVEVNGEPFVAFGKPFPNVRVPATLEAVLDPGAYEAFTCLAPGARLGKDGKPVDATRLAKAGWAWRKSTSPVGPPQQDALLKTKVLPPEQAWLHLRDVETGKPVHGHGGSVAWNAHRGRWIAIVSQAFGTSVLGEVYFAEADTLLGPWVYARKVVTHETYSFYNPKHHPFFDQEGGRRIHFEGTYTATFSGNEDRTPRYDYNQVMYRLDLDDPRLATLPVPVYRLKDGSLRLGPTGEVEGVAFFASCRPGEGLVAIPGVEGAFGLAKPGKGTAPLKARDGADTGVPPGFRAPHVWPSPISGKPLLDTESHPRRRP